jgi:hypothetical protein
VLKVLHLFLQVLKVLKVLKEYRELQVHKEEFKDLLGLKVPKVLQVPVVHKVV